MVRQSRKHLSRGQARRRRHLREQNQRVQSRESAKYVYKEFAFGPLLEKYKIEALLTGVAALCVLAAVFLWPGIKANQAKNDSVSSLLPDRSFEWGQEYPYGYKIIALTDKEIMHTSYDTLPEELEIDWKNLSVARVQANRLSDTEEKIRIEMPEIHYLPAGVSGLTITFTLLRQKGAAHTLAQLGEMELIAEILEDREGYLFCLFGLKGK